jgi:S-adenosylmethionine:tRNA ribosyltransferase-isomerase
VVNDAATVPASLFAVTQRGVPIEVRLLSRRSDAAGEERWRAVLFGAGDWRTDTEQRPAPGSLDPGERIDFGPGLAAVIAKRFRVSPRLVELTFTEQGDRFWRELYRLGKPVQYSYLARDLALAEVQTSYATRPWAVEMPSAGRPLSWSILLALAERGVRIRALTHAAGLSSTGDKAIDAAIPFDEEFEIPASTVRAVEETRARGGRVIAVGTTVVRALEGGSAHGALAVGRGSTDLKIDGRYRPTIVSAILTGVHERTASHSALLEAFAPRMLPDQAAAHSAEHGYLGHEFGDSWLIY